VTQGEFTTVFAALAMCLATPLILAFCAVRWVYDGACSLARAVTRR